MMCHSLTLARYRPVRAFPLMTKRTRRMTMRMRQHSASQVKSRSSRRSPMRSPTLYRHSPRGTLCPTLTSQGSREAAVGRVTRIRRGGHHSIRPTTSSPRPTKPTMTLRYVRAYRPFYHALPPHGACRSRLGPPTRSREHRLLVLSLQASRSAPNR